MNQPFLGERVHLSTDNLRDRSDWTEHDQVSIADNAQMTGTLNKPACLQAGPFQESGRYAGQGVHSTAQFQTAADVSTHFDCPR